MAFRIKVQVLKILIILILGIESKVIGLPASTSTEEDYPGCGVRLKREYTTGISGTIARGTVAKESDYPWMAFLYNFDRHSYGINMMDLDLPRACKAASPTQTTKKTSSFCGGSVINPRYILTAAHCVACRTTDDIAVAVGGNEVYMEKLDTEEFEKFKFLSKIIVFPKYIRGVNHDIKDNPDVALLQLERSLIFGPKINSVCLPTNPNNLYEEEAVVVTGWGKTEKEQPSEKLMEAVVKVFPNDLCKQVMCANGKKCFNFLKSFHLCTYDLKDLLSHCEGDSGGPLMRVDWQNESRHSQIAVASFGDIHSECGRKPAGFTRLTPDVLNWVKSTSGIYHPGITKPAVLITGGDGAGGRQSAEIFHPDSESESFCYLRHFPEYRSLHTQDGSLKCGGMETPRSCLTWNSDTGSWDLVTDSLTADRVNHISWTPADRSVTYLMGGLHSYKTSEVIDREGRVSASFPLKHRTEAACAIPDPDSDTVVVTGGEWTPTTVSRYGKKGWIEEFRSGLITGRHGHSCSSFLSKDNERVLLVAGGHDTNHQFLTCTEAYRPSAGEWKKVPGGTLPRTMFGNRMVTLNNRVFIFGGEEEDLMQRQRRYYADILEYSDSEREEKWTKVGELSKPRKELEVSIVDIFDMNMNICKDKSKIRKKRILAEPMNPSGQNRQPGSIYPTAGQNWQNGQSYPSVQPWQNGLVYNSGQTWQTSYPSVQPWQNGQMNPSRQTWSPNPHTPWTSTCPNCHHHHYPQTGNG